VFCIYDTSLIFAYQYRYLALCSFNKCFLNIFLLICSSPANSTVNGEAADEQSLGAGIRQAMTTLDGDLASIEDPGTQLPQTSSEESGSGSSHDESSIVKAGSNTSGLKALVINDFIEINAQEEEMKKKFAAKVAQSQQLFKETYDDFLSFTQFQFVFNDKEERNINLSRADVIKLHNQHIETVAVINKMAKEIGILRESNEELLSEKKKWEDEKERISAAEEEIKKVYETTRQENKKLEAKIKEKEDTKNSLKKDLQILEVEKKILVSAEISFNKKREELESLNEEMEREKEGLYKQGLKKDIEIEELKETNEKKRKELKDLREFKQKVFRLQEEMVSDAVKCENRKWLDVQESWFSEKKALEEKIREEKRKKEKSVTTLIDHKKQVKELQQKIKDINEKVQKTNKSLFQANLRLLSVGIEFVNDGVKEGAAKIETPKLTTTTQNNDKEDVIEIDSD